MNGDFVVNTSFEGAGVENRTRWYSCKCNWNIFWEYMHWQITWSQEPKKKILRRRNTEQKRKIDWRLQTEELHLFAPKPIGDYFLPDLTQFVNLNFTNKNMLQKKPKKGKKTFGENDNWYKEKLNKLPEKLRMCAPTKGY